MGLVCSLLASNDSLNDAVENGLERKYSDCKKGPYWEVQVESFKTRQQAMERIKEIKASLSIQAEKGYDSDDPNADETGHVWVISISLCNGDDAMYLCTDGLIR